MGMDHSEQLIGEVLGSAHVFDAAVSSVMDELLSRAIDNQLTPLQLKILRLLHLTDASSVADVAAFLGVSNAAASKTIDRLVRRKFLGRVEDPEDRRSTDISLTLAGEAILGQYERAKFRKLKKVFRPFTREELSSAAHLMERLAKAIVSQSANLTEVCLQCGIHLRERCLVREAARAECAYQSRKSRREVKGDGTKARVTKGGRPGLGPPD